MDKNELWLLTLDNLLHSENADKSGARSAALNMLKPLGISNNQLILLAKNETVENIVNKNYLDEIKEAIKHVTGQDYNVLVFLDDSPEVNSSLNTPQQTQTQQSNSLNFDSMFSSTQEQTAPVDFVNVFVDPNDITPSQKEIKYEQVNKEQSNAVIQNKSKGILKEGYENLFSKCTFDSFIVGSSNNFARGAALAVAEQPGSIYNPLFIYGNSGLGKTHLLIAIANYIHQTAPNMSIVYATASDFLNDYVSDFGNNWVNFNKKYHGVDVLLIDDIQYLADKGETLNQLFQLFNEMTGMSRQIVLSADRSPKDIDMDERMRSRFMNGLLADVRPPDYETRLAIIKNFYAHRQQTTTFFGVIPDEVLDYIAKTSTSNIREIEGAVTRIIGNMSLFNKATITIDEAKDILHDFFPDNTIKQITISTIQSTVENFFDISHEDMISNKRSKPITGPRHIAIYLARYLTEESLETIGKKFGGRDHTTVMYSVSKIEKDMETNKALFDQIEKIRMILKE